MPLCCVIWLCLMVSCEETARIVMMMRYCLSASNYFLKLCQEMKTAREYDYAADSKYGVIPPTYIFDHCITIIGAEYKQAKDAYKGYK